MYLFTNQLLFDTGPGHEVAVEDRDMSKILDTDGNAYIGFTASTGSKGFAKVGYDPEEVGPASIARPVIDTHFEPSSFELSGTLAKSSNAL